MCVDLAAAHAGMVEQSLVQQQVPAALRRDEGHAGLSKAGGRQEEAPQR